MVCNQSINQLFSTDPRSLRSEVDTDPHLQLTSKLECSPFLSLLPLRRQNGLLSLCKRGEGVVAKGKDRRCLSFANLLVVVVLFVLF